jgi:hypothetical protein
VTAGYVMLAVATAAVQWSVRLPRYRYGLALDVIDVFTMVSAGLVAWAWWLALRGRAPVRGIARQLRQAFIVFALSNDLRIIHR